jgi:hypothetical protein
VSHAWMEGSRIGEASNPGPTRQDETTNDHSRWAARRRAPRGQNRISSEGAGSPFPSPLPCPQPLPRHGGMMESPRGSTLVYRRARGYNRSGPGPTALWLRLCPARRRRRPSSPSSPPSCDLCSLVASKVPRAAPPHDLALDGDIHPNPGPNRRGRGRRAAAPSRTPSRTRQQQHQQPSGSHAPARTRDPAQAPARQRDARAAPTTSSSSNVTNQPTDMPGNDSESGMKDHHPDGLLGPSPNPSSEPEASPRGYALIVSAAWAVTQSSRRKTPVSRTSSATSKSSCSRCKAK